MNKTIFLRTLTLTNFKGVKNLTINFNDQENSIKGDNATGKTTVMDAFTYLLFDKDSSGRKDFNIKPLLSTGESDHNKETEVCATLTVNDETISLRKVYKEKWTKPRGQTETVFDGHTTTYYFNEVPLAQKDYNIKIELICPEKVFKLLTNPHHFPGLNWVEQRQMLINVAGTVSDKDIASINPAYADLLSSLNGTKTILEYQREIASKKKKIKEDLEQIPARIDEVKRGLPNVLDWADIEKQIAEIKNQISEIDQQIIDAGKGLEVENSKRIELQKTINSHNESKSKINRDLTTHLDDLKFGHDRQIRLWNQSISDLNDTIEQNKSRITSLQARIETLKTQRENKISEWHKINDEQLTFTGETLCPTCGQDLPEDFLLTKKNEAESKFNNNKSARLSTNQTEGKDISNKIKEAEETINTCNKIIAETEAKITEVKNKAILEPDYEAEKSRFLQSKNYGAVEKVIPELEKQLEELGPAKVVDTSELQNNRKNAQSSLDELKKTLLSKEQISTGNQRIDTLKSNQSNLSQELADLEKIEYTIAGFNKAKIEAVEAKINSMFRIVKFKMYNQQVNGGESETCECTVDGVPYSDLNNAMKINAGIDILSTLSEKYGVKAPIFLDNRESVNKVLQVQAQIINLIVTKDKQLVIN